MPRMKNFYSAKITTAQSFFNHWKKQVQARKPQQNRRDFIVYYLRIKTSFYAEREESNE